MRPYTMQNSDSGGTLTLDLQIRILTLYTTKLRSRTIETNGTKLNKKLRAAKSHTQ